MQSRKLLRVATRTITGLLIITLALGPLLSVKDVPTASGETDETLYYLLTDHLGSVDVVLDKEGNVVERRDYLPYGSERTSETNPDSPATPQKFTGKELDDETGLYYYGARYFDPLIGRFVSMDPAVLNEGSQPLSKILPNPQALNAYSYVLNNPVKFVDPTGMYRENVHYDLTFYLSLQAGLTRAQSKYIAYRDQNMDDNWKTRPENPNATMKYHFAKRSDAKKIINAAIKSKSSPALGSALHTFQDTYSHSGLTPVEHLELDIKFENPDRTYADVNKAMKMAEETFFYLRMHNLKTAGPGEISPAEYRRNGIRIWKSMKGGVEHYLSLEKKENTAIAKVAKESKNKY